MSSPLYRIKAGSSYEEQPDLPMGMFHGYGTFTSLLALPGEPVYRLADHYQRLKADCQFFNLVFPWEDLAAFEALITGFIAARLDHPSVIRVTIVAVPPFYVPLRTSFDAEVFLSVRSFLPVHTPVRVCTVTFDKPMPQHKHMSHIGDGMHFQASLKKGFHDFIRVSSTGWLTEASRANLFLVTQAGGLLTPSVEEAGCLPGITRQAILALADEINLPMETGLYPTAMLKDIKGAFLTNAVQGVYPIRQINDISYDVSAILPVLEQVKTSLRFPDTL